MQRYYANAARCLYKIGDIEVIEKVQKRATKLVIQLKKLLYFRTQNDLKYWIFVL